MSTTPTPTFNPAMLVLARESRGLTQAQLATKAGISQGNISKYENGLLIPNDERLDNLATKLDYPRAFFFRGDGVFGFGSPCLYHRKRQSMPVTTLRTVHARVNMSRIQVMGLLRGVDVQTENRFDRMDLDVYDGSPERIAQLVRASWRLPLGPVESMVGAIESAGGVVVRMPFGTNKLDAVSQWPVDSAPMFFLNSELPEDRLRFTSAHEVGHVVMHFAPTPDMEREADRFASELLMPAQEIAPDLDRLTLARAAELKLYWKVSMAALVMRARDLGKISPSQAQILFMQLSKMGYRTSEPFTPAVENPTVVRDVVDAYLRERGYDVTALSQAIGLLEAEFKAKYMSEQRTLRIVG